MTNDSSLIDRITMLLSYHLTSTKKLYFQTLLFPHTISFITNFPIKISNLNTKPFSVVTSFRSSAMSQISKTEYTRLMLQHFGSTKTPAYSSVSRDQRVSLKSISHSKGSLADVCTVLNIPLPAAAGFSAAVQVAAGLPQKEVLAANNAESQVPAPAGPFAADPAAPPQEEVPAADNAETHFPASADPSVEDFAGPPQGGAAAPASAAVAGLPQGEAEASAANNAEPQVPAPAGPFAEDPAAPPQEEVPEADNAEPQVPASAGSSASAAPLTALSNEPQKTLSQATAPTVNSGAVSNSARVAQLHASAAADASIPKKRVIQPRAIYVPVKRGGARQNHQIDFGQGLPNPIFDQEKDCFKNSIALLMRLQHIPTSLNLQSPNMSLCDINVVLNQGGYYLRKLPLYFDENQKKFFKPEMPTLLAAFLQIKFGVDLPWLHDSSLDDSQIRRSISRVLIENNKHNYLPFLILNPFNNNGVPLHCVGLECRWNKAIVWDPANVNSFEFSLRTLHALCDGRWTPSFRRIWCLCART